MREILFRGKGENGEWLYGYPSIATDDCDKLCYFYIYDEKTKFFIRHIANIKTLGQFTGLTDKNGTKIFEGDIVKYTRTKWHEPLSSKNNQDMICFCEIYFDEKTHCFRFYHYDDETKRCIGSGLLTFDDSRAEENIIEVIGNKWDNPELLKERDRK